MSKILCYIVYSICFFASMNVTAQSRWSFTGISADTSLWFLDKAFTRKKSGTILAWEKVVYPNKSFSIGINEWNCAEKKKRLIQADKYTPNGEIINQHRTPMPWRFVIPDSIEEITFNIICEDFIEKKNKSGSASSFAEITAGNVNLMSDAGPNSEIIRKVSIGEKLTLVSEDSVGVWYRVLDAKTNSEGWLNGYQFKIVKAVKPAGKGRRSNRRQ